MQVGDLAAHGVQRQPAGMRDRRRSGAIGKNDRRRRSQHRSIAVQHQPFPAGPLDLQGLGVEQPLQPVAACLQHGAAGGGGGGPAALGEVPGAVRRRRAEQGAGLRRVQPAHVLLGVAPGIDDFLLQQGVLRVARQSTAQRADAVDPH